MHLFFLISEITFHIFVRTPHMYFHILPNLMFEPPVQKDGLMGILLSQGDLGGGKINFEIQLLERLFGLHCGMGVKD